MSWFSRKPKNSESYTKAFADRAETTFLQKDEELRVAAAVKVALEKERYKTLKASLEKDLEAFKASYVPVGPRYKIVESPQGGYNIHERRLNYNSISGLYSYGIYGREPPTLEQLENFSPMVRETYLPIFEPNDNVPLNRRNPKFFSTFEEAEYFLLRTASPEQFETHYDGEPLRRITKTSDRKINRTIPI